MNGSNLTFLVAIGTTLPKPNLSARCHYPNWILIHSNSLVKHDWSNETMYTHVESAIVVFKFETFPKITQRLIQLKVECLPSNWCFCVFFTQSLSNNCWTDFWIFAIAEWCWSVRVRSVFSVVTAGTFLFSRSFSLSMIWFCEVRSCMGLLVWQAWLANSQALVIWAARRSIDSMLGDRWSISVWYRFLRWERAFLHWLLIKVISSSSDLFMSFSFWLKIAVSLFWMASAVACSLVVSLFLRPTLSTDLSYYFISATDRSIRSWPRWSTWPHEAQTGILQFVSLQKRVKSCFGCFLHCWGCWAIGLHFSSCSSAMVESLCIRNGRSLLCASTQPWHRKQPQSWQKLTAWFLSSSQLPQNTEKLKISW